MPNNYDYIGQKNFEDDSKGKVIKMKISVELDDEDSLHFIEIIKRLLALLERMEANNDE